ncbi:MAG: hypothetical protein BroJett025_04830 [Patescibacteria group bacterium]|nr:MAG: hypothetical protein BroJett025_04830 [Patescibacteria group bacterium]
MSILLLEFNDNYYRDVVEALVKKDCPITHIVTTFPDLYRNKKEFSNIKIIDEKQFHFADKINGINKNNPKSLSKKTIYQNFELESLYLSITDRTCFYPKTVQFRKQQYYELLLFWKHFLEKEKIKRIIFPRVPHLGYGNIVLALAKQLNIKCIIVRETLLDDTALITNDYNNFKKIPSTYLSDNNFKELKMKLGERQFSQIFQQSILMKINIQDNKTATKQNNSSFFKAIIDIPTIKALFSLIHNPFERVYFSPTYMEKPTNWFGYYLMIFQYYFKNKALFNFYNKTAKQVQVNKKFVYFALHFQPERTSMPEGDIFENQLLAIDILSKSLPTGWLLYVKEHPNQFSRTDTRKMNFRTKEFYEKINQYKNIRLVSLDTSSQDLIKHSQCTVTLTGSSGWESLIMGKPVLTFSASAWYSPCNACYIVTSQNECKEALKMISNIKKTTVLEEVLRYLLYYKKKFINTATSPELAALSPQPRNLLIDTMANAIIKEI